MFFKLTSVETGLPIYINMERINSIKEAAWRENGEGKLVTVIHFSSNDTVYVKESMEQTLEWLMQVA